MVHAIKNTDLLIHDALNKLFLYNVDTGEYNTLPNRNGKYRFINILYRLEENQMKIVEYDIEYVK